MTNDTFKKKVILLVFILICSFQSLAQNKRSIKEFSKEFSVFLTELQAFMTASENSELKSTFKAFNKASASFTLNEQSSIIDISNKMLDERLKPKPHFNHFFKSLMVVKNHSKTEILISEWLSVIEQTVENTTTKKLMMFCVFTTNFMQEKILRSSKSAKWITNSDDFHFSFETIEPIVSFSNIIDLSCLSKGGRIDIFGTKGVYYPISNEWIGGDGIINWENKGYSKDSVYAQISNYKIDTRKSQIVADSSIFYNNYIFKKPIIGQIVNKVSSGKQAKNYPKFTSYSKNIEIKEIFPDIDYKGGYKMLGKDFVADGGEFAQARIIFKKEGKDIFVANAKRFNIGTNKITSQGAGVKIFFDNDSIYHSSLKFKYINSSRKLELYREKQGISGAAMLNTYHKLTMDFELLEWNIDSDIITFGSLPGSAQSVVNFESVDMYLKSRFESLQGIDAIHPLFLINNYVKAKQEEKFYVKDFARFAGYPLTQIQHYLISLASNGFVFYDFAEERVTVQPMLYNYIEAASEIGDYDVIAFNSIISVGDYTIKDEKHLVNAALNLKTKDLNILGIHDIEISSERGVYLSPYSGKLIVKKNRDFIFNGQIFAGKGRLNLYGKGFYFHYDEFKIDLNEIDSVQLKVPVYPIKKDMYGFELLTKVKTVIEAVTGDLRIDHPSNKSGIRKDSFPGFPVFSSFDDSYAYYDRNSIHNGVYNRDLFSFHLQPFEIDSLDNYTGKGLWFAGTFESAGIFPVFDDTLRLQDDYSLGFNRKTPEKGFDIYGGKGKYNNAIHLSHKGLKGIGDFEYLTAKASADEIFFFPDSANLHTNTFAITEVVSGIEFPEVSNTKTYAHFLPYLDKLEIDKKTEEFDFFKGQAAFNGDLLLQPTSLTGAGVMTLDKAEVSSNLFIYNANWFGADTASLNVFEDGGKLAFKANNLRSHIDLKMREGVFYSNGKGSYVTLPANKYICYIDKLNWEMDKALLTLGDQQAIDGSGSEFISVHPLQDSLSFIAMTAEYSLKDYVIHAGGIDELAIADAIIYPDSGILTVEKEGVIQTLHNSKILVDDLTEYHTFTSAIVDIKSANNYTASGDYTYTDALNNEQYIFFNKIIVNEDTITVARGDVKNEKPFHIGSKFDFKGSVEIFSDKRNLTFDGYFKVNHQCELINKEWIKFRSEINPTNIIFSLENKIYNDEQDLLSTSLVLSLDSTNFYTTFISKKVRAIDADILSASSSLQYDTKQNAYIIGGPDSLSNYYTLFDKTCSTKGKGEMDLNLDLGGISIRTVGDVSFNMESQKTELNGFLMLDFFFSEDAMEVMAKDIYSAPGDGLFEYDDEFSYNLAKVLGQEKGESALLDLELHDAYSKFPDEMNYSLVFPKNKFIWDNINKAYVAKGDIWLGNINDSELNALLEGYIIIEKGRNSDILTIYLQTEFYDEYYFQYKNGVMRAWSTNLDFTTAITEVSDGKRRVKGKKGTKPYRYMTAPEDVTEKFLKMANKKY